PCDHALVEEHRLERRASAGEAGGEPARREPRAERLGAVLAGEIPERVHVLEDEPRPESPNVPERDARPVVELEDRALVTRREEPEASGHPQVDEQRKPALEADDEVLAAPLDGHHAVSFELLGHLEQVVRPGEPRVEDLNARERSAGEARLELGPDRLDLGQLGHGGIVGLRRMAADPPQTWHYGLIARYWAEFNDGFRPQEIPYFQRFIEDDGQPALDVACGTGRLLVPYLRAGLDVDGCDVSADMVALCRDKAEREGFSPNL